MEHCRRGLEQKRGGIDNGKHLHESQHKEVSGQACRKREDGGNFAGSDVGSFCGKPAAVGILRGNE